MTVKPYNSLIVGALGLDKWNLLTVSIYFSTYFA